MGEKPRRIQANTVSVTSPSQSAVAKIYKKLSMLTRTELIVTIALISGCPIVGQEAGRPLVADTGINLPARPVGPNDLIAVAIYGAPELSRTIRVASDGLIRLPMVKRKIKAEGEYPADLEASIVAALSAEHILNDAFVTVTIAEYHSYPITVSGAVKKPLVFQASTPSTLLEALARADGLRDDAGGQILVTRNQMGPRGVEPSTTRQISARALLDARDPLLNIVLTGGEIVLVPAVEKVYVIGNVKKSGAYPVQSGGETTIFQMLALAEGLAPFATKEAYIYRRDASGTRNEISVPLSRIMQRKAPDVTLVANDILYIPDNKGKRLAAAAIERIAGAGAAASSALVIYSR